MSVDGLPRGVRSFVTLPAHEHEDYWDSIVVPPEVKDRLLGSALLALLHGRKLASAAPACALNGLIVLAGPPGTGKSTLARGLTRMAADTLRDSGSTAVLEIDAHALPSELLGESQRNVVRLLRDSVPELARRGRHAMVVIDEVESFAIDRRSASFETNPVDVQRATDAVLEGMDHLRAELPGVVFVTTTNFPGAVDEAFLSRADLVTELALPDAPTRQEILRRALTDLLPVWPGLRDLAADEALLTELALASDGWDGRALRRLPLAAAAADPDLARDPGRLSADGLRAAMKS
ncbi:MAG TPA: AAA family ATPase [Acidimicrobiales bacterium]|nr:AAA family ATPase [Acidimicrobiales bacterium]